MIIYRRVRRRLGEGMEGMEGMVDGGWWILDEGYWMMDGGWSMGMMDDGWLILDGGRLVLMESRGGVK